MPNVEEVSIITFLLGNHCDNIRSRIYFRAFSISVSILNFKSDKDSQPDIFSHFIYTSEITILNWPNSWLKFSVLLKLTLPDANDRSSTLSMASGTVLTFGMKLQFMVWMRSGVKSVTLSASVSVPNELQPKTRWLLIGIWWEETSEFSFSNFPLRMNCGILLHFQFCG